jgi:hypothetical protein
MQVSRCKPNTWGVIGAGAEGLALRVGEGEGGDRLDLGRPGVASTKLRCLNTAGG